MANIKMRIPNFFFSGIRVIDPEIKDKLKAEIIRVLQGKSREEKPGIFHKKEEIGNVTKIDRKEAIKKNKSILLVPFFLRKKYITIANAKTKTCRYPKNNGGLML